MMNDYIQAIQNYLKDHGFEQLAPEAVLFDMDGVLFDSMRLHNESWQATAAAYNLEMLPDEPYTLEGCTSTLMINTLMERTHQRQATAEELETIYAEKRRRFNALPRPKRMPGAVEMLEKVGRDGLQRVVVTGSGQRSLLERLQTAFPNVFRADLIVSSKDYTQGKPAPDPYLCGLKRTSLRPNQALVVENAPLGVEAAVKAGIFTIAVNTGPLPDEALRERGADLLFPSMQALATHWEEIRAAIAACAPTK